MSDLTAHYRHLTTEPRSQLNYASTTVALREAADTIEAEHRDRALMAEDYGRIIEALTAERDEAVALLREVQESGVSWEAKGKYRETQIDATTSDAIFAFLARTG